MKEIITGRLIIRPWTISDSSDLYEYAIVLKTENNRMVYLLLS